MLGTPLIYLPLICMVPFVFIGVTLVRAHLKMLGAKNILSYRDFIPAWVSHRYTRKNQPVTSRWPWIVAHYKWFWLFNCKVYCPLSVALLRYSVYLVKIVENWWCPFDHERKAEYADAPIDNSYWHVIPSRQALLHPDDAANPIWNNPPS